MTDQHRLAPVFKVGGIEYCYVAYSKTYTERDWDPNFLQVFGEDGKPESLKFTGEMLRLEYDEISKLYYSDKHELEYGLFFASDEKMHNILYIDRKGKKLPVRFFETSCKHTKVSGFGFRAEEIEWTDNVCLDCGITLSTTKERIA